MIWLMNSHWMLQRAIAIGLVLLVASILALLAYSAVASLSQKHTEVDTKRQLLGRLQQIAEQLPVAIAETSRANQTAYDAFLSGESETLIRAELQQRFKQIANTQRVSVISVGNAPDFERDAISYAGLQANMSGTIANLHNTLLTLESSSPLLFITQLTIRSTDPLATREPVAEPVLMTQLRLYGAIRPVSEEAERAQ